MQDNTVILGITPTTRVIFDEEFPGLLKIEIVPYDIRYSHSIPLTIKLMLDAGRIFRVVKKEYRQLQEIITTNGIDVVISDNRFGLYSSAVETVYITHQLTINAGILSSLANYIHHRFIKKFMQVWVPDHEDLNASLAGNLSRHAAFKNARYLGPLSRLIPSVEKTEAYDCLILLSGAEPQRTLLEEYLVTQLKHSAKKVCLVRGSSAGSIHGLPTNIRVIDFPDALTLSACIQNATKVICRSGYSTLMDLNVFNKQNLVLIPTPGQAEQLYLANYWKEKYGSTVVFQHELNDRNVL